MAAMKRLLHYLFLLTCLWLPSANAETEQASFGGTKYEGTYKGVVNGMDWIGGCDLHRAGADRHLP